MLPEQAAAMTAGGAPCYSVFIRLEAASGPVRAWLGVGDYDLPADDVDLTGGTYLGIGLVGEIPALRQLVGGLAERVEISLSGADEITFALADDQASEVRRAPIHVGVIFFDDEWQAVAPVAWLWDGEADSPAIERGEDGDRIQRRVTLSVGSAFTDRSRPVLGFYTPPDQKRRSPTDTFCDRVPAYTIDNTIQFPGP